MLASYSVGLRPNVCCNFVSLGTQCISLAEEFQQLIYHEWYMWVVAWATLQHGFNEEQILRFNIVSKKHADMDIICYKSLNLIKFAFWPFSKVKLVTSIVYDFNTTVKWISNLILILNYFPKSDYLQW